jgi:hypothetical protein
MARQGIAAILESGIYQSVFFESLWDSSVQHSIATQSRAKQGKANRVQHSTSVVLCWFSSMVQRNAGQRTAEQCTASQS